MLCVATEIVVCLDKNGKDVVVFQVDKSSPSDSERFWVVLTEKARKPSQGDRIEPENVVICSRRCETYNSVPAVSPLGFLWLQVEGIFFWSSEYFGNTNSTSML